MYVKSWAHCLAQKNGSHFYNKSHASRDLNSGHYSSAPSSSSKSINKFVEHLLWAREWCLLYSILGITEISSVRGNRCSPFRKKREWKVTYLFTTFYFSLTVTISLPVPLPHLSSSCLPCLRKWYCCPLLKEPNLGDNLNVSFPHSQHTVQVLLARRWTRLNPLHVHSHTLVQAKNLRSPGLLTAICVSASTLVKS